MSVASSGFAPRSSASIALQLLQSVPGGSDLRAARPPASSPPAQAEAADSVANLDKLANAIRLGQKNAFDVGRTYIDMSYETAAKVALAMRAQGEAMVQAIPQALSAFSPEDAARLQAFGADAAVLNPELPQLDDAAFNDIITRNIKKEYAGVPGFAEAMAAGTVVIRRASDVPEFNYGHKSFSLYKDGNMIGGAGWGKPFNQALYDQVAASGLQQAFGGAMGADYYITWPRNGI